MSHRDDVSSNKRKWRYNGNHHNGKKRPSGPSHARHTMEADYRGGRHSRWDATPSAWDSMRYYNTDMYLYENGRNNVANRNDIYNNGFANTAPPDFTDDNIVIEINKMDKILATKKRLEEALASSTSKSLDVRTENEVTSKTVTDLGKPPSTNAKLPLVDCLDLKLTNSDFTEIGSVASGITGADVEGESNEVQTNVACGSSQRSFDNTYKAPAASKSPKLGGWSIDQLNDITPTDTVRLGTQITETRNVENKSSSKRIGKMYIQESTETILGPTISQISLETSVDSQPQPSTNTFGSKQNYTTFSRVGQLYQSFLKSRLSGYTPKIKGTAPRPVGTNPLLDMSAIIPGRNTPVIELEMPKTVQVKAEVIDSGDGTTLPDGASTAEEANEFCKEFGFLLSYPNLLISQDNLEKLGLGHLSEMNKMINTSINPTSCYTETAENLSQISLAEFSDTIDTNSPSASKKSKTFSTFDSVNPSKNSVSRHVNTLGNGEPEQLNVATSNVRSNNVSGGDSNLSAEYLQSVVKSVMENIMKPTENNSLQSLDGLRLQCSSVHQSSSATKSSISGENVFSNSNSNKIEEISKRILDLFFIDKQIQELMEKKNKIYSELFSTSLSFTLFNTQTKNQQENFQGNILPGGSKITKNEEPSQAPATFQDKTLYETMMELQSLKEELKVLKGSASPDLLENGYGDMAGSGMNNFHLSQNEPSPIPEKPKLSVRKDLVDPSVNLIPNSLTIAANDTSLEVSSELADQTTREADEEVKKQLKYKRAVKNKYNKGKRKDNQVVEVIDLIGDVSSDEDEPCESDSVPPDSEMSQDLEPEAPVIRQPAKKTKKKSNLKFDLKKNTATCIATLKKAVIIGCQKGFLIVSALNTRQNVVFQQLHEGAVLSLHPIVEHRCVITGSADSWICLFSLESKTTLQKVQIRSPIQCIDLNFKRLFIGTGNGFIFTTRLKSQPGQTGEELKLFLKDEPLQVAHSNILALKAAKEGPRKVIIVASRGENVTVRDANSGLLLRMFSDWLDTVYCLQTFGETPVVYCGTSTQSVRVVNYMTGENAHDCLLGRSIIQIAFQESVMFAASFDGQVYIYDIQDNRIIHILSPFKYKCLITSLAVLKNQLLVANNKDDVLEVLFPPEVKQYIRKKKKVVCESKSN